MATGFCINCAECIAGLGEVTPTIPEKNNLPDPHICSQCGHFYLNHRKIELDLPPETGKTKPSRRWWWPFGR